MRFRRGKGGGGAKQEGHENKPSCLFDLTSRPGVKQSSLPILLIIRPIEKIIHLEREQTHRDGDKEFERERGREREKERARVGRERERAGETNVYNI